MSGEASIYTEKGNIELLELKVNKEFDVRAKNGSIDLLLKSFIGGDATLKSDKGNVRMADTDVKDNLSISAHKHAMVLDAYVGGSMLMKGDEEGCIGNTLVVGKDLIVNTQTGSINIENANVYEDTYLSIDGKGGNIDIDNIKTGNNNTGDLIVVSHSSNKDENHHINISNAQAGNKIIINAESDINLKSAYALNGRLEVKTGGDIFAEIIKAATTTYISTIKSFGLINISKLISGDSISVYNLIGSKTNIDYIETTNPDSDITLKAIFGEDAKITNASTTRDLIFSSLFGNVYLENVYAGNDVKLESLFESNIEINNTNVGNDMTLTSNDGDITVKNANVGNNFKIYSKLHGEVDDVNQIKIDNVNVANKAHIETAEFDNININKLKSREFELIDHKKSNAHIANSDIGDSNIIINGNMSITFLMIN